MRFFALVVNFEQHRRKCTIHFTKMLVNRNAHLERKLGEDQQDGQN